MFGALGKLIKKLRGKSYPAYLSGVEMQSPSPSVPMVQQVFMDSTTATSAYTTGIAMPAYGNQPVRELPKDISVDNRIEKKPIDLVCELVSETPVMFLNDIRKQISEVERRMKMLKKQKVTNMRDEEEALGYLRARKNFKRYADLFKWAITTDSLIDTLRSKFKVMFVGFSSYYKTVPTEALDELEKFLHACKKVGVEEPEVKLIVDEGGKEHKKDPIMLGKSPFGRWWYVIGAWDKEVQYVDDILYHGK